MQEKSLLELAAAARLRAYAPHSGFMVGAALLTAEGVIFTGANIENSAYGETVCAERVAVWSAVAAGYRRFKSMAIVADCSPPPVPCGACRQVLSELAGELTLVTGNLQGEATRWRLSQLIPAPFKFSPKQGAAFAGSRDHDQSWRLPVTFTPVGFVSSDFKDPAAVPLNCRDHTALVIVDPALEGGLYRLEEEERIIIVAYLHRSGGYTLKGERKGRGGDVYGVFACRSPFRPNPISLTEVELLGRAGPVLTVRGLDLVDKTPVLDIKPALPADRK